MIFIYVLLYLILWIGPGILFSAIVEHMECGDWKKNFEFYAPTAIFLGPVAFIFSLIGIIFILRKRYKLELK